MRFPRSLLTFLCGAAVMFTGSALGQVIAPSVAPENQATATAQIFPDVEKSQFFAPSVASMMRSGVVKGYDDGNFGPEDQVTRGQVTVMIDRYDKNVVQPLREQLDQLRSLHNLGRCGDGAVQTGEQCDDGNTLDGDGCSARCLTEISPPPPSTCGNGKCDRGEGFFCAPCAAEGLCTGPCFMGTCPKDCPAVQPASSSVPRVGGDRDAHGCIPSAGYSWCEAKQKCLRIWEEPCS